MLLVEFGVGLSMSAMYLDSWQSGELVYDTIGRMGTAGLCILGS